MSNPTSAPTQSPRETGSLPTYVLVTPARNEAGFIEETIKAVVAQTVRPLRWVIVSDGSTDGTDEIVQGYARKNDWIELVRTPERKERHFAGKVHAFNAGYARLKGLDYQVIGNLDADITVEPDHFEFLMSKFAGDSRLGVAGTPFREGDFQYNHKFVGTEHVSGACQLFKRECFEGIGGYTPLKRGVDLVAVTTARMRGWRTRSFVEKCTFHHRKQGTGTARRFTLTYSSGYYDYVLGVDIRWQLVRAVYEMRMPPYVIGGCLLFWGYLWAMLTRAKRPLSAEFLAFRRREQMQRLRSLPARLLGRDPRPGGRRSRQ